jgi:hypothetical protein
MNKQFLKTVTNILLIIFFIATAITGLSHLEEIHETVASTTIILIIVHLILNWEWFSSLVKFK